jgi:hypothetical protein
MTGRRTTKERGLGGSHPAERRAALKALKDGDLCFRCELRGIEHPMYRSLVIQTPRGPKSPWLDLDEYPGRAVGGPQIKRLSYRRCNRSHGATFGNIRRGAKRAAEKYTRW